MAKLKDTVVYGNLDVGGRIKGESTTYSEFVRKHNTAGIYAGLMLTRELASGSTPPVPFGIGGYFKTVYPGDNNPTVYAGLFGGRIVQGVSGDASGHNDRIGEVVFTPSWNGQDPYANSPFRIRAKSKSTADVFVSGDVYVGAPETGRGGTKVATINDIPAAVQVIDNYNSDSTTSALSAAKGKDLNTRLTNLGFRSGTVSLPSGHTASVNTVTRQGNYVVARINSSGTPLANGSTIFTLPSNFRPKTAYSFSILAKSATGLADGVATLTVNTNGACVANNITAAYNIIAGTDTNLGFEAPPIT